MFTYSAICDVPEETLLHVTARYCGGIAARSAPGKDVGRARSARRRSWCCGGSATTRRYACSLAEAGLPISTSYRYLHEAIDVAAICRSSSRARRRQGFEWVAGRGWVRVRRSLQVSRLATVRPAVRILSENHNFARACSNRRLQLHSRRWRRRDRRRCTPRLTDMRSRSLASSHLVTEGSVPSPPHGGSSARHPARSIPWRPLSWRFLIPAEWRQPSRRRTADRSSQQPPRVL